jgi:hypothetical protein
MINSSTESKKRKLPLPPRDGGRDGEFERFIERGLQSNAPGIATSFSLGCAPDGTLLHLNASCDPRDWMAVDTRMLRFSEDSDERDLSIVTNLQSQILGRLEGVDRGVSDLGQYRSWLRHVKDPVSCDITCVPCPRLDPTIAYSKRQRLYSKEELDELEPLRGYFIDNFIIQAFPPTECRPAQDTAYQLCDAFGWRAGESEDYANKYYITKLKTSAADLCKGVKIKVSTADIPLAEVFAARDLIQAATSKQYNKLLRDDQVSHVEIGRLLDSLKSRHPQSALLSGSGRANVDLRAALRIAATCVEQFIDIDVTQDEPATTNYPVLCKLLTQFGYEIADSSIGVNAVKTKFKGDGSKQFSIMVYAKEIETLQQPGKSRDRSLDSKVHRLPHASTFGLRRRFAHSAYQNNGCTRTELKFAGSWSVKEMLEVFENVKAMIQRAFVVKSIHDHLADSECFLNQTLGVYIPSVHDMKVKALRSVPKNKRRSYKSQINHVSEGLIMHYKISTTKKKVGRPIASPVNLVRGSNGSDLLFKSIAFESPCNTPIILAVLLDYEGMKKFMAGELPLLWLRIARIKTFSAVPGQEKMFVSHLACQGIGPGCETNMAKACGVHVAYLDKLKIAASFSKKGTDYSDTPMRIMLEGCPADGGPVKIHQPSFTVKGSADVLPSTFTRVRVIEAPRGKLGRPSKTDTVPLAFSYKGDTVLVPEQHQEAIRSWFNKQINKAESYLLVRLVDSRFEFSFLDDLSIEGAQWIHGTTRKDSEIPVREAPIKILAIRRRKNGRGASFEFDIEGEGSFRAPVTTAKHLVCYLRKTEGILQDSWLKGFSKSEPSWIDLSNLGFYLEHREQRRGRVSGGKGDDEEFITIVKRGLLGNFEYVLGSEETK